MKPLEIKDFSGGMTDNILQGEAHRAARLFNLLVGIDHKLYSRDGTLSANTVKKSARIASITPWDNMREMVYSSEGHFYDPTGAEIVGPSGNAVFPGISADAQVTYAEFQKQLILANDEQSLPAKIYRDGTDTVTLNTVGLPQTKGTPNYDDGALLAACIASANSIKAKFLVHIKDAEGTTERSITNLNQIPLSTIQPVASTKRHWAVDKYAKSYLESTTFSGGEYAPTNPIGPAPDATDYDSLVFLAQCLSLAFEEHRHDSASYPPKGQTTTVTLVGNHRYHAIGYMTGYTDGTYGRYGLNDLDVNGTPLGTPVYINPARVCSNQGIQQQVSYSWDPSEAINDAVSLDQVYRTELKALAKFLDDLLIKFWLHEFAPCVHRYPNQSAGVSNPVSLSDLIGPVTDGEPMIVASPVNFWLSANYIQRAMSNHNLSTDQTAPLAAANYTYLHTCANYHNEPSLPRAGSYTNFLPATPTDQQQAVALIADTILAQMNIFTTRYMYYVHTMDLRFGFANGPAAVTGPPPSQYGRMTQSGGSSSFPYTIVLHDYGTATPYTQGRIGDTLIAGSGQQISNTGVTLQRGISGIYLNGSAGSGTYSTCYNSIFSPTYLLLSTFVMHPYPIMVPTATSFLNFDSSTQWLAKGYGTAPLIGDLNGWGKMITDFVDSFYDHLNSTEVHYHQSNDQAEYNPPGSSGYPAGDVNIFPLWQVVPSNLQSNVWQPFFTPTMVTYGYASIYSDKYAVGSGGTEYEVNSNPIFSDAIYSEEILAPGTLVTSTYDGSLKTPLTYLTPVAFIFNTVPLTNDTDTSYSANVTENLYRTTGNGTTYYRIHPSVPGAFFNGSTTVTPTGLIDLSSDTTNADTYGALQSSQEILYTDGGIVGSSQPPKCKMVWSANDYYYYAAVMDGTQFLPNRVLQSQQLAPDWVPGDNSIDFDSDVVGGGSARNVNVVITTTGVFRVEGAFGIDGSGTITKQRISNQVGGLNAMSVVSTEIGIFFAGTDGFYYTDGYQMIKVSIELNTSYQKATKTPEQKRCITGRYDRINRRIYWTMRSDSTQSDCDVMWVFDLNFGTKPSGLFTHLFGANSSWNPSAIGFVDRVLYIGDKDGYLYKDDEDTKTDPLKDLSKTPDLWTTTYLPWEYLSVQLDFGTNSMRKFFSRIHHIGKNRGPVAMDYYTIADGKYYQMIAPIRFNPVDEDDGINDQWRRVGGKKLRAGIYQIGVKNGFTVIYKSDDYPTLHPVFLFHGGPSSSVLFDASGSSVVLPADCVGMYLTFSSDFYTQQWLITGYNLSSGNTLLFLSDPDGTVQAAISPQWEIKGFLKDQAFSLDSLDIWYGEQGNLGSQYLGASSPEGGGGNA